MKKHIPRGFPIGREPVSEWELPVMVFVPLCGFQNICGFF